MKSVKNFLPRQYDENSVLPINHNYLTKQFSDYEEILEKISVVVRNGDYTLGRKVDEFENHFCETINSKFSVGVGSGTDALFLSLKAFGIGDTNEDEVITTPFTFYATIGAIVTAGARPVFADIGDDYNIDPEKIEAAITPNTKAIVPVHWSGKPCDMDRISKIAEKYGLKIIEDACHAITATYKNKNAGTFGDTGCFSMHPLKNLNVWGDGGIICTQSEKVAAKLRLLRNHGLSGRNTCEIFAYNSRLDTIQAVVAEHLLRKLPEISKKRIENSRNFDKLLLKIPQVTIPPREEETVKQVFHIYSLCFERRDELQAYLIANGVDAKIHYPTPMHLQPASKGFGYKEGDFPIAETVAKSVMSLPVHEYITADEQSKVVDLIESFYA
ncbi:putative PLP-dependent enzyme possibly involved in cell wall biogenesis [SAR116 cluster alpha proteobacterium HIMB100]|nr:putative PLP-dependent enzyme possibly involved in cell wall biogenesis [SAR116 cluster alpha proteobacterium HIMB100]